MGIDVPKTQYLLRSPVAISDIDWVRPREANLKTAKRQPGRNIRIQASLFLLCETLKHLNQMQVPKRIVQTEGVDGSKYVLGAGAPDLPDGITFCPAQSSLSNEIWLEPQHSCSQDSLARLSREAFSCLMAL